MTMQQLIPRFIRIVDHYFVVVFRLIKTLKETAITQKSAKRFLMWEDVLKNTDKVKQTRPICIIYSSEGLDNVFSVSCTYFAMLFNDLVLV